MKKTLITIAFTLLSISCSNTIKNSDEGYKTNTIVLQSLCKKIARSYPFKKDSIQELSIEEFDNYFSVSGILKTLDDNKFLTEEFKRHLKHVENIHHIFYKVNGKRANSEFKVRFLRASQGFLHIALQLGNTARPQLNGPRLTFSYEFPSKIEKSAIEAVTLNNQKFDKEFHGPWAFFRFLDDSETNETENGLLIVRTDLPVGWDYIPDAEFTVDGLKNWLYIRSAFRCPNFEDL